MNEKPLESLRDLASSLTSYLPTLMAGFLVLVLGLVVAWIGSKFIVRVLIVMRLDRVIGRLGWGRALQKGDVRHALFGLIGNVCGFLIFLVFLDNAVIIWHLTVVSHLLGRLVALAPQIFTAIIVLMVGWGIATAAARSVQKALLQEEFERAQLLGRLVRTAILVVTVAIALVELKIAVNIVTGAFLLAFGSLCVSFVLAIGLGSKRAVEIMWEERLGRRKNGKAVDEEK